MTKHTPPAEAQKRIVVFRNPEDGWTAAYFLESREAVRAVERGLLLPILYPPFGLGCLEKVWSNSWCQPRHQFVLGFRIGITTPKLIHLHYSSTRPGHRRQGIATLLLNHLCHMFPKARVEFRQPTHEGAKLIADWRKERE
jgi:ribosomal protein S18 acetylase RimI-like enzyme